MSLVGQCLCGAVRVDVASGGHARAVSVCHCGTCRVWSGGCQASLECRADAVTVSGPVGRYRSSAFAERAWCKTCGTQLWLRDEGGPYDFLPGIFPGAREYPLAREVYADRAMAAFAFEGTHPRISRASYEQSHPHTEGDTP